MRQPLVSIIVPCYNQGQYIKECLDSVMAQTYQDFEVIVIDDGSTDIQTQKILKTLKYPKTKVFSICNKGLAGARNFGISKSKGIYILPLDADDKIHPDFLRRTVKILEHQKEIGFVGGQTKFFGELTGVIEKPYLFPQILSFNPFQCTSLFRKSDWEKVGGYNSNMIYGMEDWDFWLSLIEKGLTGYKIPKILFFYRRKKVSMITLLKQEKLKLMKEQLIKNHPGLYQKHPEEKNKLLGIIPFRKKCVIRCIKLCCLLVPIKSWRHRLRKIYK